MSAIFESRLSDSPYIEIIWRGRVEADYSPVCPADVRWNLLFTRYQGETRVSVEGATSQFVPKTQSEGAEFLVIKFKIGVFMPCLPAGNFLNSDVKLPEALNHTFYLKGAAWQIPDFENAETFVARLARDDVLVYDPVVDAALKNQPMEVSSRTLRRRFLRSTGLTPTTIHQIERAQQAASLLEQGISILDVTYNLGYADQPHLTRSLRRFMGQTPAQIARWSQAG